MTDIRSDQDLTETPDQPLRINLDMVGCRLNQSEIEQYARQFRAAGHTIVATPGDADLVVVNTCGVTAAAAADSRSKARRAHRAGAERIILTGCWSTLAPAEAASLPGVVDVVPNDSKDELVGSTLGIRPDNFDLEPVVREPLPGARLRTRAFIKVQDGCDNRCTFCVTTIARGVGRSRPIAAVLDDIRAAVLGGAQEAVLTGVHLGSWGQDLDRPLHLKNLVQSILAESDLPRLRLSSLEPWDLDEAFFEIWADPRLCRHLHLPLQSGSGSTLRRMARKTTPALFARLVRDARQMVPEMAITTDIIVGFPGETDAEFDESLDFVASQGFAGGHVFTYSPRTGTAAAGMPDQVDGKVRKARNGSMREVFSRSADQYQQSFIGRELTALWETTSELGPEVWRLHGLTDNQLRVTAHAPKDAWNQIS
ncbi:MAG: MiaB/RimO family radical SAM methylthiotransferase, partial [Anaerolineales bacterium]|nr:MiaB/RimO family radical SAM methylthiotransferase [Anaerolineales bacterium]